MKKIQELIKSTAIKQPLKIEKSNKDIVRILYVEPSINSDGYYRMILPFLELPNIKGFETRVTSVKKWDFIKRNTIGQGTFQEEEIQWADFVVFPMLLKNYTYLLRATMVLNPAVVLVMDMTRKIYDTAHMRSATTALLQNLLYIQVVTSPSKRILHWYRNWLCDTSEYRNIAFFWLPSLLSKIGFEGVSSVAKPKDDVVRVGMIGSIRDVEDYIYFGELFNSIKEKYKDNVELVIFGWLGMRANGYEVFKDIEITYHKSVSFLEYYQTLKNLHFDIVLIPMRPTFSNEYASTTRFLEAATIGLPVIASSTSSFVEIIEHQKNGILAGSPEEWESTLIRLINEPETRKKLGENAKEWAWRNRGYTKKNLARFKKVFTGSF